MTSIKCTFVLFLIVLTNVATFARPPISPSAESDVDRPVETPFRLCNDSLIVVKGTIGDIENLNIILDTGASPTIISPGLAARLKLSGTTEPSRSGGGKIEVQDVVLPRIDIGALHIASLRGAVQDLTFVQRGLDIPIAAVAGLDVLSSRSFMIDYVKRKIVFQRAKPEGRSVRFETQRPGLTVKVKIEGQEFRLLVDSGTPGILLFRHRLNSGLTKLERLAADKDPSIYSAAGKLHAGLFRAPHVSLGDRNLGPQVMLIADAGLNEEFDGFLGLAQTGFHRVWFDFEQGIFEWE